MFNPDQFLDMQVTESNSTEIIPVPEGEFVAVAYEVKCRQWQKKDDPSVAGLALDVTWEIDDANVKAALGRDKVTVKQGLMLDLTEAGGLDMGKGKNVSLGRLRDALGLNAPGQPFAFSMITGRVAKIATKHRMDGDQIRVDVKGVARMA